AGAVLDKFQLEIAPREFNESVANKVIYIQDAREKDWDKVLLAFVGGPQESKIILGRKGKLNFYAEAKRATVELFDAVQHTLALDEPEIYQVAALAHVEEEIDISNLVGGFTPEKRAREQNIRELAAALKEARAAEAKLGAERAQLEARGLPPDSPERAKSGFALEQARRNRRTTLVEIHKRFSLPFVCWVFVFLGLPLGLSTKKGGRTSGFTLSIVIILAYYVFITAGEKLAIDGRVEPWVGMWGGNIVFGLLSVVLFVRSARERPFFASLGRRREAAEESGPRPPVRRPRRLGLISLDVPFPNVLDRYVIRRYLFIAVLIILSILAVSAVVTFFDRLGNVYDHQKPLRMLLDYIRYRLPEFFHMGIPVTALLATLLTLGFFSKFNELTAMKACGISLYRTVAPILVLGAVAGGLSFAFQENILPGTNRKAAEIWDKVMDRPPRIYGVANRRWVANAARDRFYHYTAFDPTAMTFARIWVEDLNADRWAFRRRIFAERGKLEGETLRLEDGWVRDLGEDGTKAAGFEKFAVLDVPVEGGRGVFLKESKEPDEMKAGELGAYIGQVRALGYDTTRLRVDLATKTSFPIAALIMTLVGVPFAFSMGKRGTLVGVGVGTAIAIVYWVAIGVFRSLGYAGMLTVFLAAWGPNLIFGLLGLYLFLRLRT
ncbi:MAG: LptF/LptG family permease, partial [Candidatus Aminicenantes bacterium]|nr:LptF/LptG family permease [Candidatus Aminicenantes bacterium]